jgi:hypothetical protein
MVGATTGAHDPKAREYDPYASETMKG